MKKTTADLLILQAWHYRNDPRRATELDTFGTLAIRAGRLARAMLQGEKYGMQAFDVAVIALEMFEEREAMPRYPTLSASTITALEQEIARCRAKFPKNDLMLAALTEEIGELAEALQSDNSDNICKEALQVACVAVRIAEEGDTTFTGASKESQQK